MTLVGLLLGEILDSFQAEENAAGAIHYQRSEMARQVDDREMADRQTDEIEKWLRNPEEIDMTTVDTPMFQGTVYNPLAEFEDP